MKINFKSILGKHILVGISLLNGEGTVIERIQFHGIIEYAKRDDMISIRSDNIIESEYLSKDRNGLYILPPDLNAISIAGAGEYILKYSGEKVIDPYLVACWTIKNQ